MAQMLLFDPEVRRVKVRPPVNRWRARANRLRSVRPLPCARLLPCMAGFFEPTPSPELQAILGSEVEPEATRLTRRERINLRNDLRGRRRETRRTIPKEARDLWRQDELSCEVLEALDGFTGTTLNTRWMQWWDGWIHQRAAEVRALWSDAEERNRRTGLTANQLDPNEHVLPPLCSIFGHDPGSGDE